MSDFPFQTCTAISQRGLPQKMSPVITITKFPMHLAFLPEPVDGINAKYNFFYLWSPAELKRYAINADGTVGSAATVIQDMAHDRPLVSSQVSIAGPRTIRTSDWHACAALEPTANL